MKNETKAQTGVQKKRRASRNDKRQALDKNTLKEKSAIHREQLLSESMREIKVASRATWAKLLRSGCEVKKREGKNHNFASQDTKEEISVELDLFWFLPISDKEFGDSGDKCHEKRR